MTRDEIIREIQAVAEQKGGHVGLAAFLKETGIPQKQILGKYWATWNEALRDAGLETKEFRRPRANEAAVLEAVAKLIERLEKWPTENEYSLERRQDPSFPSLGVIRRYRKSGTLAEKLLDHCTDRPDLRLAADVAAHQQSKESSPRTGRRRVQGYVYMMRSGRRYKIGHTNSPARRHREVRLDLPDPTHLVHAIETDDPRGIEAYWHQRFESKRVRDTEFFELNAGDVAAFKWRKYQ